MWLGLLGVACFALTLPATRLATGSAAAPQMSAEFVTIGRVAVAGLLSALFLLVTRSPWPPRSTWGPLALAIVGNVFGFPLLLALAVPHVSAAHAAVVLATLPLATAVLSALLLGQRARPAFWACAVLGAALVAVFMWRGLPVAHASAPAAAGVTALWLPNLCLLGAVLTAALGYVCGAKVTPVLGAERVICWMCAAMLPLALPLTLWLWPSQPVAGSAWAGFAYAGTVSMWAGFFAWYRGLDWGGALRVSQVQLLQPFLAMLAAWPLLCEPLQASAIGFTAIVILTVYMAKRFAQPTTSTPYPSPRQPMTAMQPAHASPRGGALSAKH
nr:DMT family transporter [Comamonas serinivorans]